MTSERGPRCWDDRMSCERGRRAPHGSSRREERRPHPSVVFFARVIRSLTRSSPDQPRLCKRVRAACRPTCNEGHRKGQPLPPQAPRRSCWNSGQPRAFALVVSSVFSCSWNLHDSERMTEPARTLSIRYGRCQSGGRGLAPTSTEARPLEFRSAMRSCW